MHCTIDLKQEKKYMNFVESFNSVNDRKMQIVAEKDLFSLYQAN